MTLKKNLNAPFSNKTCKTPVLHVGHVELTLSFLITVRQFCLKNCGNKMILILFNEECLLIAFLLGNYFETSFKEKWKWRRVSFRLNRNLNRVVFTQILDGMHKICTYRLSGRAERENIWLEVITYGPNAACPITKLSQ